MMTSASPSATAKSRVQLRSSRRNCGNDEFSFWGIGSVWGVSDILCSNIYNTAHDNAPIASAGHLQWPSADRVEREREREHRGHPQDVWAASVVSIFSPSPLC